MDGATGEPTQLDPRVITLWRQHGLLVAAPVAIAAVATVIAVATAEGPTLAVALVAVVLVGLATAWAVWFPTRRYQRWSYRLDPVALEIRRGAFIRRRSVIPYFRVQHVDTSRGPLERRLGLAQLKIHTASSSSDATIPGIDDAVATELRTAIVARVGTNAGV